MFWKALLCVAHLLAPRQSSRHKAIPKARPGVQELETRLVPTGTTAVSANDYTPKLSADYLHNLTTILADYTSIAPDSLNYSIPSEPATVHDLLLEKSDGTFELAVWDERVRGSDNVTVNLGATYGTVNLYDPTVDSAAIDSQSNVSSVSLTLSDHPVIIEIPSAASPWGSGRLDVTPRADSHGLNLTRNQLPQVVAGAKVVMDLNAAGHGGALDNGKVSPNQVDLPTVVNHELDRVLGLPDLSSQSLPGDAMNDTLPVGVRRLSAADDALPLDNNWLQAPVDEFFAGLSHHDG